MFLFAHAHVYHVFIRKHWMALKYVEHHGAKLAMETNLFSLVSWEYLEFMEMVSGENEYTT